MASRLDLAVTFLGDLEDTLLYVWDELRQSRECLQRLSRSTEAASIEGRTPLLMSADPEHDDNYLCSNQVGNLICHVREQVYSSMEGIDGGLNHTQVLSLMMNMDLESLDQSSRGDVTASTLSTCDTLRAPDLPGSPLDLIELGEPMSP